MHVYLETGTVFAENTANKGHDIKKLKVIITQQFNDYCFLFSNVL